MRPARHFNVLIAATVCIALQGCGSYFAPDRNLKRKVSEAEIVGTWKLTADTLALLQYEGFVPDPTHANTITLNSDGTLQFASVLEEFRGVSYWDATGTWTLEHDTTGNSNVRKTNALLLRLEAPDRGRHMYLNFDEKGGRLLLWKFYGDPDSWDFIEYERDT